MQLVVQAVDHHLSKKKEKKREKKKKNNDCPVGAYSEVFVGSVCVVT